ncbi:uncharacterized protein MONBRDRAFT_27493 [Monosiga brevicollis MX1]|uniref:SH2 domain-containing protein n=1 Tax=Monosiga brevicollis TaxID=81824 RepID=A9V5F5_MONBE|nr:uncharacterized protein MONBRDRAFT_27493 [Monosiga brevicollis MX1]EDQ87362.1 predicted protein [Monosiga brevicollis MX1]|eukprot:XP_001747975.1 hypothetical protein [Monosiga brevicollis MX1]
MYLLEAKKKAEREEKEREARERRRAERDRRHQPRESPAASEAMRAHQQAEIQRQEQAMLVEAMRQSKLQAEADERRRQAHQNQQPRAALPGRSPGHAAGHAAAQARSHSPRSRSPNPPHNGSAPLRAADMPRPERLTTPNHGQRPTARSTSPRANVQPLSRAPMDMASPHSGQRSNPHAAAPSPRPSPSAAPDTAHEHVQQAEANWKDVRIPCHYVGTFEVGSGEVDRGMVKKGVEVMDEYAANARPTDFLMTLKGIRIVDKTNQQVAMAHALQRISMSSIVSEKRLFGLVAKNPGTKDKYCHVFKMARSQHTETAQALLSKAFKLAFAKNRSLKAMPSGANAAASPAPTGPPAAAQPRPQPSAPNQEDHRRWAKQNQLVGLRQVQESSRHPSPALSPAEHQPKPPTAPTEQPAAAQPSERIQVHRGRDLALQPVLSLDDEQDDMGLGENYLQEAPWYQAGLPREIAVELLAMSEDGAFIVRDSQSQKGCYALTMKAHGEIKNFIIKAIPEGYIIGAAADGERPYASLAELILAHAERRGVLPMVLSLDTDNKLYNEANGAGAGDEEEESYVHPDYQSVLPLADMLG